MALGVQCSYILQTRYQILTPSLVYVLLSEKVYTTLKDRGTTKKEYRYLV